MSGKALGNAKNNLVERPVSLLPVSCISRILEQSYDAVFFFDVPNDILLCQHIKAPLTTELCNIRMLLHDAVDYWINNIVDAQDREATYDFFNDVVFKKSDFEKDAALDFKACLKSGLLKNYTGYLFTLGAGRYLFCCEDVTVQKTVAALKQRNDELEKQRMETEIYRVASEYSGVAVLEWNHTDKTFVASPGYSRYAASKYDYHLLGQNVQELSGIHPEDYPRFLALQKGSNGEKNIVETTLRIKSIDNVYRWTNLTTVIRRTEDGKVHKTISILQDIDELVLAKAAQSKSEARFSQVINNIVEGVVIFEMKEGVPKIKYVSDTALRFYGIGKEEYWEKTASGEMPAEIIKDRILSKEELETLVACGKVTFSRFFFDFPTKKRFFEAICSVDSVREKETYYVIIHETTAAHEAKIREEWQQERYRMICQGSDVVTFDYNVAVDELTYSFNLPPDGYQEKVVPAFLADIEISTLFREAQLQVFKAYINELLKGEAVEEFEILLNLYHQGFEWHTMKLFGMKDEAGNVCRIIGRTRNIQKEKEQLMKRLRSEAVVQIALSSEALFSAAFNRTTGEKVNITGEVISEKLKFIRNISQVFDYLKENVHPRDVEVLLSNILGSNFLSPDNTTRKRKFECRIHTTDQASGEYRWVQITYMHAFNELTDSPLLYIFVMDIDEEKKRMLQIVERVDIDATTKFLNRVAFEKLCQRERSDPDSQRGREMNALVILELEIRNLPPGYKSIQRIETTAKEVADTLRLWTRKEDIIARFSDMKFLICMHSLENGVILRERIESLRKALNHFEHEKTDVFAFIGVTKCCHDCEKGFIQVYDQAEIALLMARANGGQQVVFYTDSMDQRVSVLDGHAVQIRTFGYFDVFVDQKPIVFKSTKSKELLALLVDRRGGFISTDEAISYLWEDEPADKVTRARYRKVAMRLKETLEQHGVGNIIEVSSHRRRIVTEKVQCDLFDYVSGKPEFSNLYNGSYLLNYSWAEVTSAQLNKEYWTL